MQDIETEIRECLSLSKVATAYCEQYMGACEEILDVMVTINLITEKLNRVYNNLDKLH